MTAVRRLARAVLVLAAAAAMLWTAYGPQGFWTLAWLVLVFVTIAGAVLGASALQPEKGDPR